MNKIEKKELVEQLKTNIGENNFVLAGFNGLTVFEMESLRNSLRRLDCSSNVIKNRLLNLALKELGVEGFDQYLNDKTILTIHRDKDSFNALKEISKFLKTNEKMFLKAGRIDGKVYEGKDVLKIASLPAKDVLIASLLSQMNSPISKFVYALNNPISKLVYILEAVKNKKN